MLSVSTREKFNDTSFIEMVTELNDLENVFIYESAQPDEWGVIVDSTFQFKMKATELNSYCFT